MPAPPGRPIRGKTRRRRPRAAPHPRWSLPGVAGGTLKVRLRLALSEDGDGAVGEVFADAVDAGLDEVANLRPHPRRLRRPGRRSGQGCHSRSISRATSTARPTPSAQEHRRAASTDLAPQAEAHRRGVRIPSPAPSDSRTTTPSGAVSGTCRCVVGHQANTRSTSGEYAPDRARLLIRAR